MWMLLILWQGIGLVVCLTTEDDEYPVWMGYGFERVIVASWIWPYTLFVRGA